MQLLYSGFGFILANLLRYRYSVSLQNITRSFPLASYEQIAKYHKDFYKYLSRMLLEGLRIVRPTLYVQSDSLKQLQSIKQQNKHIILILGHYGNWEILSQLPLSVDMRVQALYKPIKSKFWNGLMRSIRQQHGVELIASQNALRTLIKQKDDPAITFFIADQFPGGSKGLVVDFLSQPTGVLMGAEHISKLLDAYVFYAELCPRDSRSWELRLETICPSAKQTDEGFISSSFFSKLEQSIQNIPHIWLWTHKRWKKR
ncbi:lysophospholipid acyltransferase family protein [Myroides sp. LJL119]